MQRERVSEDVYVFTSELYAQVTAGAVITPEGAAVIDTLAFPSETREMAIFIERRLGVPVRYVILTHYHADHVHGAYLFPRAQIVGHTLCRALLAEHGPAAFAEARGQSPELAELQLRLPEMVFEGGDLCLYLGHKSLQLSHSPGHSPDAITVLVREDRILFASDTVMPVPYIVDGDVDDMLRSLEAINALQLENIVQGHGEVVLRGEIDEAISSNIHYLQAIRSRVERAVARKAQRNSLRNIDIEKCGKSRLPLNGLVEQLHRANLFALYDKLAAAR
jgi:glyoxylase-like metal-dependent hydrolase (beta-lactamase superfamily II)